MPKQQRRGCQNNRDLDAPLRRETPHSQSPEHHDDPDLPERAGEIQHPDALELPGVRPQERHPVVRVTSQRIATAKLPAAPNKKIDLVGQRSNPRAYSPWAVANTTKNAP